MAFYGVDPILVADVVLWPARSIIKVLLLLGAGVKGFREACLGCGWFSSCGAQVSAWRPQTELQM